MFCPSYARPSPFAYGPSYDCGYYDALARQHELEQRRRQAILLAQREAERQEQLDLLRAQAYRREQVELARRRQAQLEAAELARRRHVHEEHRLRQAAVAHAQRRQQLQRRQLERAATIIQRAIRTHLAARPRHAELNRIAADFDSLKSSFALPSASECVGSAATTMNADAARRLVLTDTGSLAFVPANVPLRAHEEALTRLLTRLDAVDSAGNQRVRDHRRQLVLDIERELERLEQTKLAARQAVVGAAVDSDADAAVDSVPGVAVEESPAVEDVAPADIVAAQDEAGPVTPSASSPTDAPIVEAAADADTVVLSSPARSRSPSLVSLASDDGFELVD